MATKDYAEGYTELYGEEWVKLSDETTEKELKDFYVEWSKTYDTVSSDNSLLDQCGHSYVFKAWRFTLTVALSTQEYKWV